MDAIQSAYSVFESYNLSVTTLIVLALIFALAFLFSVREAAAWFFKIDDLKRELKRLNESALHLEAEIAALKEIVSQARHTEPPLTAVVNEKKGEQPKSSPQSNAGGFPIVH